MSVTVKLPSFEGPLDLLLHLIEKNQVDICDIPIYEITKQYLEYLDEWNHENMVIASEFIVMAATLIKIKARMLIPSEPKEEDADDPREDLIRRLLEYKRFKEAAAELKKHLPEPDKLWITRAREAIKIPAPKPSIDQLLKGLTPDAIYEIYRQALQNKADSIDPTRATFNTVAKDSYTIDSKIRDLLDTLEHLQTISYHQLRQQSHSRQEEITYFLAMLELNRSSLVYLKQENPFEDILMVPADSEEKKPSEETEAPESAAEAEDSSEAPEKVEPSATVDETTETIEKSNPDAITDPDGSVIENQTDSTSVPETGSVLPSAAAVAGPIMITEPFTTAPESTLSKKTKALPESLDSAEEAETPGVVEETIEKAEVSETEETEVSETEEEKAEEAEVSETEEAEIPETKEEKAEESEVSETEEAEIPETKEEKAEEAEVSETEEAGEADEEAEASTVSEDAETDEPPEDSTAVNASEEDEAFGVDASLVSPDEAFPEENSESGENGLKDSERIDEDERGNSDPKKARAADA